MIPCPLQVGLTIRLFGIQWDFFATERTETFEKERLISFSLWSLWLPHQIPEN